MRILLSTNFIILLVSVFCFVSQVHAFDTTAPYAVLMDYDTGTIMYSKKAEESCVPSSLSKNMTAYLVFERLHEGTLSLDDRFTVSKKAWAKQGSKMFLEHNESVSVKDLLHGIVVLSGNDACITIAEGLMGSEEDFVKLMNLKAKELGLKHSHFVNAHGWPDPGHVMSMLDIAILARHIISDFPEYYYLFSEKSFTHNRIKQNNRNTLLFKNIGVDGIKTGVSEKGGYGHSVSAVRKGRRVIAVLNGMRSAEERSRESARLLNYGFEYFSNIELFGAEETAIDAPVWLGSHNTVPLVTMKDVKITLPRHTIKNYSVVIDYKTPVSAPVSKKAKLGTLSIINNSTNKTLAEYNLYAKHDVAVLPFWMKTITKLQYYITHLFV